MTLREQILGAQDGATKEVPIPEWGTTVTVKAFTGAERDAWETKQAEARKAGKLMVENYRAKLATMIIVDGDGNRVFTDADADALGKKSGKALDRIFDAFVSLNKLSEADAKELEKN